MRHATYAEPFAGGGGLALGLLMNGIVDQIRLNDFDLSIYSVWYAILNKTDEFCDWIQSVEVDIDSWKYYKSIQSTKNDSQCNLLDLAKSTFFLNRTNVSGIIKAGVIGGVRQNGKYDITIRFNKPDLISRIQTISDYKSDILFTNLDCIDFLNMIQEENKDNTLVFLDPPYYHKGSDLYMNFFVDDDHIRLKEKLLATSYKWLLSYDNHPFIRNLYESKNKVTYSVSNGTSNRRGCELLVFADSVIYSQSISEIQIIDDIDYR